MEKKWWQEAVVYQVYCKSFFDSDGDGIGDLKGVLSKLDYIKELGANCIWFNPLYVSPQVDNGYDIADYRDIDPVYGTLDDFRKVLDEAHKRGIRVVMDMVLNHTSDEHKWFVESRKSKDNPYRDYYIWRPGKDGKEPNNWGNYFFERSGSAWEYDEATGEYYLHQYSYKMPDLNWEYEPLRKEMYSMMKWWLDMGVDGFRLDVINILKKPSGFPDSPLEPTSTNSKNGYVADRSMTANVDGIHDLLREINEKVWSKYDIMTVGELSVTKAEKGISYFCQDNKEIDMVFMFELANRNDVPSSPEKIKEVEKKWIELSKRNAWLTQFFTNHDLPRQVSRFGNDKEYRVESAKAIAMLIHTLPGTPFIYQGEEIGMTNVSFDSINDYNDRYTVGKYDALTKAGGDPENVLKQLRPISRDNARTPFQWNGGNNAGFTTGKPWIKVCGRYKEINAEKDLSSPDSIYYFYQKLISLRKSHSAFIDGNTEFVDFENAGIIAFTRSTSRETLLSVINMSDEPNIFDIGNELSAFKWKLLLSNLPDTGTVPEKQEWRPWECALYSLEI